MSTRRLTSGGPPIRGRASRTPQIGGPPFRARDSSVRDVEVEPAYCEQIELADWLGDQRVWDLATAWGQADRLRFGY